MFLGRVRRISTVVALCAACVAPPVFAATERAEDTNQDGRPDTWLEEVGGVLVALALDRNFDGAVDARTTFDREGRRELEEFDFNFDGEMDDFYHYEEGVLARQEVDSNFDGAVDVWVHLVDGLYIARYEQDTDFDGSPDRSKVFGELPDVAKGDS